MKPDVDPVVTACMVQRGERTKKDLDQICDFLNAVKFFAGTTRSHPFALTGNNGWVVGYLSVCIAAFQSDTKVLHQIAQNVELHVYKRGEFCRNC
jgi:hypothetical protein